MYTLIIILDIKNAGIEKRRENQCQLPREVGKKLYMSW